MGGTIIPPIYEIITSKICPRSNTAGFDFSKKIRMVKLETC